MLQVDVALFCHRSPALWTKLAGTGRRVPISERRCFDGPSRFCVLKNACVQEIAECSSHTSFLCRKSNTSPGSSLQSWLAFVPGERSGKRRITEHSEALVVSHSECTYDGWNRCSEFVAANVSAFLWERSSHMPHFLESAAPLSSMARWSQRPLDVVLFGNGASWPGHEGPPSDNSIDASAQSEFFRQELFKHRWVGGGMHACMHACMHALHTHR